MVPTPAYDERTKRTDRAAETDFRNATANEPATCQDPSSYASKKDVSRSSRTSASKLHKASWSSDE
jgi:hypothetical protein